MIRERKFRVWDKINKRMIVDNQDFMPLMITNFGVLRLSPNYEENLYEFIKPADKSDWDIMEFVGIRDDEGNDIYEGDICELEFTMFYSNEQFSAEIEDKIIGIVKFYDAMFIVENIDDKSFVTFNDIINDEIKIKIIGHKYNMNESI